MKKLIKITALLLAVITIIASLSGCSLLDELRASCGYIEEVEGTTCISYNDVVYKALPFDERLSPIFNYDETFYISEPDIPLLLVPTLGTTYYISVDGKFVCDDYSSNYFCREDIYDELIAQMNDTFPFMELCYSYYGYDEITGEYTEIRTLLSSDEIKAISDTFSYSEPITMPDFAELNTDCYVEIFSCSKDALLLEAYADLISIQDKYYIITSDYGEELYYEVPAEQAEALSKIISNAMATDSFEDYEFDYELY